MKPVRLFAAAVLLAALPADAGAQIFAQPRAPLDPGRASVRDAVLVLRDSLYGVHAGGAHMRRDFQFASNAALISRARDLRNACAASGRTIPFTRAAIANGPAESAAVRRAREELVAELERLDASLAECEETFGGWVKRLDGDGVRGYGNRDAAIVEMAVRAYERRLNSYLQAQKIRLVPKGASEAVAPS